jgi:plasmid stabilization system protein ParE
MKFRVIIEPTARIGIREAIRWKTARGSEGEAARWYNGLERKILSLGAHPLRCPIAAESEKFPEEIRELLHGSKNSRYRILFTVRDDEVHVLHVRHSAQGEVGP